MGPTGPRIRIVDGQRQDLELASLLLQQELAQAELHWAADALASAAGVIPTLRRSFPQAALILFSCDTDPADDLAAARLGLDLVLGKSSAGFLQLALAERPDASPPRFPELLAAGPERDQPQRALDLGEPLRELDARVMGLQQLEIELTRGLERQEFVIHYQPIVALDRDRILGFEAVLRWRHPERGLVPAGEFIPVAEETGVMVPPGLVDPAHRLPADAAVAERLPRLSANVAERQFLRAPV